MNTKANNRNLVLAISFSLMVGVFFPMVNTQTNNVPHPLPLDNSNWWNTNWPNRKLITIDHTKVDSNLINFPVLFYRSSDSDLANKTQPDGHDIVFVLYSDNTTKLNHEIEVYNSTNGNLVAWINVTSVRSAADTKLWMYYGNPSCSDQENVKGTWNGGFKAVYHLKEGWSTTAGHFADSTVNNYNGTLTDVNANSVSDSGKIGKGFRFYGDADYINIGVINHNYPITYSCWFKADNIDDDKCALGRYWTDYYLGTWNWDSGYLRQRIYINSNGYYQHTTGRSNVWYHLAVTYEGTTVRYYVNGSLVGSTSASGNLDFTSAPWHIGDDGSAELFFKGVVDEVRIAHVAQNSSWLGTSYRNQNNPESFYSVGAEEQYKFTLTTTIEGQGTVTKNPDQTKYTYGQVVTLTAVPNTGWGFNHWSGNLTGNTNPTTITITGNKTVVANFTQKHYTLAIAIEGQGTVSKNPNQTSYTYGQVVTLTAVPSTGWSFNHWSGNLTGSTNPTTITMTGNKTVVANFTQKHYTLAISVEGQGTVSKNPNQTSYTYGQVVTLTAIPNTGWGFNHWSGNLTGNTNPTTITMTGNKTVVSNFTQKHYILSITTEGQGMVSKNPDQASYTYGQVVTLTAVASTGWGFNHWSGDLTGSTNPTTITMNGNKTVVANFTQKHYTLAISVEGQGSVAKNPDQATYTYGQVVTLTAVASTGWGFNHWSGDLTGNQNPTTITMNGNKSVTANFTITSGYTLTVTIEGSGTVTKDPDQLTYTFGQMVTLTAVGSTGWSFNHWNGDLIGNTNPTTITMTGNKTVVANFTQKHYTLAITVEGQGTVSKNPDQVSYTYGQVVTLTAIPDTDWSFNHWSGDLTGNQNPTTITMNGNKSVIANFTVTSEYYTLTVSIEGSGTVTKDPDQLTYIYGQVVNLTAIPSTGWSFNHWSGDLTGNQNPTTITMDENKSVIANFTFGLEYTLTVTIEGSGTVTKDPDQPLYTLGQIVTLTAIGALHWTFDHWGGDLSGNTNPTTITMDGNKSVIANFTFADSPPVANDDHYNTSENTPLFVVAPGVLGNDTDSDGDRLTAVLVNGTQGGLTLRADGSFEYHPPSNYYGVVTFTYKAYDGALYSNIATVTINVTKANNPPNKPMKPTGPSLGEISIEYTFNTTTTDPDDDQVYYQWNWGDGNISHWFGPYGSGEMATASHIWNTLGTYQIKVKAKDSHGLYTSWSDPLTISVFGPAILIGLIQDVNDSGGYITFKPDLVFVGVGSPLRFTIYWSGHMMISNNSGGFMGQRFIIGTFYTVVIPDQQTSKLFPLRDHFKYNHVRKT